MEKTPKGFRLADIERYVWHGLHSRGEDPKRAAVTVQLVCFVVCAIYSVRVHSLNAILHLAF